MMKHPGTTRYLLVVLGLPSSGHEHWCTCVPSQVYIEYHVPSMLTSRRIHPCRKSLWEVHATSTITGSARD